MPTLLLCYKRSANCLYGTNHAPVTGLIQDNAFFSWVSFVWCNRFKGALMFCINLAVLFIGHSTLVSDLVIYVVTFWFEAFSFTSVSASTFTKA